MYLAFSQTQQSNPSNLINAVNAGADAIRAMTKAQTDPLRYRVRIDPTAILVADSFVQAEYVEHDCATIDNLARQLPGTYGILTVPTQDCVLVMTDHKKNGDYLVRGSRELSHKCQSGFGEPFATNECLQYSTISRPGKPDQMCAGRVFQVYLKRLGGRWFVISEGDISDWGEGVACSSHSLSLWGRRIPWTSA